MSQNKYKIWSEGYVATGEHGRAFCHGISYGTSFHAACVDFFKDDINYNCKDDTHWACRLFDNEVAARRSFG